MKGEIKQMKLKEKGRENKITIKKLKKQVKGITLIALVVTIIVLLILAGVALSLTVGDNGLFKRAENAADTWQMAEQNEQKEIDEAADWLDEYMPKVIDGVTIPKGFYYAGGSEETGLVISDNPIDEKDWDETTATDTVSTDLKGNQFVWVPVENPSELFTDEEEQLNGIETKTSIYSNLTLRDGESYNGKLYIAGKPGNVGQIVVREPDILDFDSDKQYYEDILNFNSVKDMAEEFVIDYKQMSDSIKKYSGFYIGRYEITGEVNNPAEKAGEVLDANKSENWYGLYKACKNIISENESVKSLMIYGIQWDATCEWLNKSGYDVDGDFSNWGNDGSEEDSLLNTGEDIKYQANSIFDFAGNYWEWTQEAGQTGYRIARGGNYYDSSLEYPASSRTVHNSNGNGSSFSSRAVLVFN